MKELALHILDIAENSIKADADNIYITITEDTEKNIFSINIKDDGTGIKKDILDNITDPFVTTRKTRPVGLGLSLFKAAAQRCNGDFKISSNKNGTNIKAVFEHDHIDRAPLGDISQTIISMLLWKNEFDIKYKHIFNDEVFIFDTKEIKNKLDDTKIHNSKIINWLKEYIDENISNLRGGEYN
ncbi:MAG: ATP-binding protein [Bacillota bacterium]